MNEQIEKILEEFDKYTPARIIEFDEGRIVKEYIISKNELREMLTQAYTQGETDLFNKLAKDENFRARFATQTNIDLEIARFRDKFLKASLLNKTI